MVTVRAHRTFQGTQLEEGLAFPPKSHSKTMTPYLKSRSQDFHFQDRGIQPQTPWPKTTHQHTETPGTKSVVSTEHAKGKVNFALSWDLTEHNLKTAVGLKPCTELKPGTALSSSGDNQMCSKLQRNPPKRMYSGHWARNQETASSDKKLETRKPILTGFQS